MEAGKEVTQCGVVVIMEVAQVGVRTRARAMAVVTEEIADNSGAVKRRKLSNENRRSPSSTFDREIHLNSALKENRNGSCDAAASRRSSGVPASCCPSTGSMVKRKLVSDLEESVDETEITGRYYSDGSESTPGEPESTAVKNQSVVMNNSCRTVLPAEKMPPEAELEEFFAAAQEGLNERFKNKYNYDIVNDTPLKGRFEWIQVNPEK